MKINKEFALIMSFTFLAFILGTTEYVIVGLLPDIASSIGVTLSQAGILVSGFAVAYAVGTPFVMMLASYFSKRSALLGGAVIIVFFNFISVFATSYLFLIVMRMLTAIACGLCASLSISICTELVSEKRKGKAVAYILGGFSIATVLGVPIGTFVGQQFNWQATFIMVALFGVICFTILYKLVPSGLSATASSARNQFKVMANPRVLLAFLIPIMGISAVFVIYTYITPLITDVMNIPVKWASLFLVLYGAVTIISNIIAGKVASGDYVRNLKYVFLVHALVYIFYGVTLSFSIINIVGLLAIACITFSINAATQLYLIELTERYVAGAKDFAASLMPIGANVGIAIGSSVGALVTNYLGLLYLPWAALIFVLIAFAITTLCWKLDHDEKAKLVALNM